MACVKSMTFLAMQSTIRCPAGMLRSVVIVFFGGFVRHDDLRHAEARLARRLRHLYGNRTYAIAFGHAKSQNAYRFIRRWLRAQQNANGALTC